MASFLVSLSNSSVDDLYQPLAEKAFSSTPWERYLFTTIIVGVVYTVSWMLYNLFLHPLASFPGPILARTTLLWRIYHTMSGKIHLSIDDAHRKYGKIVRVSPNELSFASVESWKAIYGHVGHQKAMIKSEFYDMYGSGYKSLCIGSERNPDKHRRMKQSLSAAFSTKALVEQESIVQACSERFVDTVGREGASEEGINMTKWFEMVAFDTLGEMAFGESFGCIEDGKPHFWQSMITEHLYFITVLDNLRRYPLVAAIGKYLLPRLTVSVRNKHSGYSRQKVQKRLDSTAERKDFFTNLVAKVRSGEVSQEEMTAHASTLIIAGGETVATFLAAVHYYLLTNPSTYDKLRAEIRNTFSSPSEITAAKAQALLYLSAVVNEGLRIYPPGSQGFPRVSPGSRVDGQWVPPGAECYTSAWTLTHDAANFERPHEFCPERWTDPASRDVREASQPFSLGPRGCLGRNFAYMEISLIMAKLHLQYDLELVNKDSLDWARQSRCHVMWWKPALNLRFTKVQ